MTSKLFQSNFAADAEGTRQCLDADMDPNERGANGETPLMVAAREGYLQIIDFLFASGADLAMKDIFGKTALVHAGHDTSSLTPLAFRFLKENLQT